MNRSTTQLYHIRVNRALDALDRDKMYEPRLKVPLPPEQFYTILDNLTHDRLGTIIRAALLAIYFGVLRQNELLPRSTGKWDPKSQPTRRDMWFVNNTCVIRIKKAKNLQKYGQCKQVIMQAANNPIVCPVRAMGQVIHDSQHIPDHGPIFVFPDTSRPVPASYVLSELHRVMRMVGMGAWIHCTSLHSIRKQAATDAFMGGCSETSIKNYGGWTSAAYQTYIHTSNRRVNSTLINSLQQDPHAT